MRIAIRSHLMSVAFLEYLQGRDALPTAVRDGTGYITNCEPGLSLPYRAPILSVEAKLADMDAAGIDLAVLGHGMPGLAGFQVWSNIGGRSLDDPGVLPVLEHIAGRGAAIHLHPAPPPGQQGLAAGIMTGFAFPVDASLAVLRLIGAGLFDRDPVIIAAHLGGVLPWLRERIGVHGHTISPLPGPSDPAGSAGGCLDRLYVDTVGYGAAPLEFCYAQFGADRMLFGTDHPYAAPGLPQELVDRLPCTQAEREQILAGNAQRLLRLGAAVAGRA